MLPPMWCLNTCTSQGDGLCDDGGPNAVYSICDPATDCTDCGPRTSLACSPTCYEYMWDDRKCDEGCNTFECGHNDCAEMEIIEHCLMSGEMHRDLARTLKGRTPTVHDFSNCAKLCKSGVDLLLIHIILCAKEAEHAVKLVGATTGRDPRAHASA